MPPFRETFWNVPSWAHNLVYVLAALAIAAIAWGLGRRARIWCLGARRARAGTVRESLRRLLVQGLLQRPLQRDRYAAVTHLAISWGFIVLFIGTVLNSLDYYLLRLTGFKLLRGPVYLGYKLALDAAGVALLAGVALAAYRRYGRRPPRLGRGWRFGISLALLFATGLSGLLLEGLRLLVTMPPAGVWSPVGWVISCALRALGVGAPGAAAAHQATWLIHLALAMSTLAALPVLNLFHILSSPLHLAVASQEPKGQPGWIAGLADVPTVGAGQIPDLARRQLVSLDACTECGFCQDACPAWNAGQPLSPKEVVLGLRAASRAKGLCERTADGERVPGRRIPAAALWACTTCLACADRCPVAINPLEMVLDMRRNLVDRGEVPETAVRVLEDVRVLGSAWGQPATERARFAGELRLAVAQPDQGADLLYWLGDTAPYDVEAQGIARALVTLLKSAGLNPLTLGPADGSDGDVPRRLGEEGLFQTLARANIDRLRQVSPWRVLTHCPHTYNALVNEYPWGDAPLRVVHHSQLLAELLQSGRIRPTQPLPLRVAYHDPCYLGRYNGIYEAPRRVLEALPGLTLTEFGRHGAASFCCGGGGGLMWMDVTQGQRVNHLRFAEAAELGIDAIATACPYCKIMLKDAASAQSRPVQVLDLAELVLLTRPEASEQS